MAASHGVGLAWAQARVAAFHAKAGHPISTLPKVLSDERKAVRASWLREEIEEFLNATDIVGQADAIIDLVYFALGTMVEMGTDAEPLFDVVHIANMRKAERPTARPSDGKLLKPTGWLSPEPELAKSVIRRHSPFQSFPSSSDDPLASALFMLLDALLPAEHGYHMDSVKDTLRSAREYDTRKENFSAGGFPVGSLAHVFNAATLPFSDSYLHISQLDEGQFYEKLSEALGTYPAVLLLVDFSQIERSLPEPRLSLTFVLQLQGDDALLADLSPPSPSPRSVRVDDLYAAAKSANDGLHRISHVR